MQMPRLVATTWPSQSVIMNFRDGRKQVLCDSFGSENSNIIIIHSVPNMCMTVLNIVGEMLLI